MVVCVCLIYVYVLCVLPVGRETCVMLFNGCVYLSYVCSCFMCFACEKGNGRSWKMKGHCPQDSYGKVPERVLDGCQKLNKHFFVRCQVQVSA